MTKTTTKKVRSERVTEPGTKKWETQVHSQRFYEGLWDRCKKVADEIPMSTNEFINQGMEGILELIETPDGKPLRAPRIVAHVRMLRALPEMIVEMRKV